ncbi:MULTISPECIES: hypothetical protein [unclassified Microbacterium]|uniref:hypothetical protein n=1 Tax=unclassified Microbacterium TaxID=2609290 RepID=UPI000EA9CBA7|nr:MULTISPECIES: hypothetical protein [unclassified Microbacterium]MBT2484929.1 hypothetical protein [Microbacterium sp. ISL-108]RKN67789.1 hypothetical protein D7252_09440 [Microbacterium sp. CGR2]
MNDGSGADSRSAAAHDETALRSDLRRLLSGVNLAVLLLSIAAATWGVFDSVTDADGDRFWGNLAIAGPGVYAGWCMFEPALRRSTGVGLVILRLLSACLIAPALVAVPVGVILAIAVIFPGMREAIASSQADNGGFHYYWSEGIVSQLLLVPLAGWMVGACVALGVCLIVTLPILSLRAPDVVISGSHIEKVEGAKRDTTAAFVFCGLGATILGIVLWVFGDGGSILEFPRDLGRFLDGISHGVVDGQEAAWLFGVLLVVAGVLAMGWGCTRVLSARSTASRR